MKQPTLRDIVNNYIMPAHMHNGIDKQAEAEAELKALIDQEVKKARIDTQNLKIKYY